MKRNAEGTRERILAAATAEFSALGIAGARVDRIARAAKANKNLIYVYFGSKEALFTKVLDRHLRRVYEAVPFTPGDLPDYAGRLFDWAMAHPELIRLLAWSGLERKETPLPEEEAVLFETKLKALAKAQRAGLVGREFTPEFLLTFVSTLAAAWTGVNPFGTTFDPGAAKHLRAIRKAFVRAVAQLCQSQRRQTEL